MYGDNGSGKSGYCRILKSLCRVRDGADEPIEADVFTRTRGGPAEVKVRFTVGSGDATEATWRAGTPSPGHLRRISVFDSRAAPLYVNKDNRVEFLPFGLDLLPRLGDVCQEIARRIDREMAALRTQYASPVVGFNHATDAGIAVAKLILLTPTIGLPSEASLRSMGSWDDSHIAALAQRERDVLRDPLATAALCDRAALAAETMNTLVVNALNVLSDGALAILRNTVAQAKAARAAVALVAQESFREEPLSGVGTAAWHQLFEHARQYSTVAYPGQEFPVTEAGARCLLCHQELEPEASRRLQRFDEFVQSAAEEHARQCEATLQEAVNGIEALALGDSTLQTAALFGFEGADDMLAVGTAAVLEALRVRQPAALAYAAGQLVSLDVVPLPDFLPARLTVTAVGYRERATGLRASAADPAIRVDMIAQRDQLLDRRQLSRSLDHLVARRAALDRLHRLQQARNTCDTTAISRAGTELRRQFITDEFKKRFKDEVADLGIAYLPLKVGDRSERGTNYVGVTLDAVREVKNDTILSEGERKALALACFLAEVGGDPNLSGLIFDDPVSSLDHRHRHLVASRLVKEAKKGRQVIVFTHDLVFYHEMTEAAASAVPPVPVASHEIRHTQQHGFGTVFENEQPWISKKARARLPLLEQHIARVRGIPDRTSDDYRHGVKAYYTDLREAWERLVEGDLLSDVVGRFQSDVKTQTLKRVVVNDDDYRLVYFAMKRASRWSGHDRAAATQTAPPSPEEMSADLATLVAFLRKVKDRSVRTAAVREALEEPPAGNLA